MSKNPYWNALDRFGLWVILGAFICLVAWAATDVTRSLYVSAIEIDDIKAGEPINIKVARTIEGSWNGGYRVTIRKTVGGSMFCTTGDVFLRYSATNKDGTPRELPVPTELRWWADGGSCSRKLANNTITTPGQYSVETCHAKRFLGVFYKWHCWQGGPIFEVSADEAD